MAKFAQELFDTKAAQYVLGCMMHTPELVYGSDKYILSLDDFNNKVYELLFGAIYNLAYGGAKKITPVEIDSYLSGYSSQYILFKEGGGPEVSGLLYEVTEQYDIAQFEFFYGRIKKFTVLRSLRKQGVDISEFYGSDLLNSERAENEFNALTVKDILDRIRNRLQIIENENVGNTTATGRDAADGLDELLAELDESPEVGLPIMGDIMNYSVRGMRKGKMYLFSGATSSGKSRHMVGNACSLAFPHIKNGVLVYPQQLHPVLFIATEMQMDEIQTLMLSYISGVNERKLLLKTASEEEKQLIRLARNVMVKYRKNFIVEVIGDPSIRRLKPMISAYILQQNIEHIFYDYIFSSPGLLSEFSGMHLREDVVLMMLSNTLKEIAAEYNVFIMTGTQLNGTWEGVGPRNMNMIRGSKAIVDKVDIGMISVKIEDEEMEMVSEYCNKLNLVKPNIVVDIYKNRRGEMTDIKIFRYFDFGTCRATDLFVTTSNYKILETPPKLNYQTSTKELTEIEQVE